LFRFVFIKLSQSHDPSHKFCMLTKVDLGCFMVPWPRSIQYVVILIYFFLNMSSWLFSTSNCIFTSRLDYLWTHRVNRVPSDQLSHFYFCLKFELHNFKLIYLWIWIEIIFVKLICMYVCMNNTSPEWNVAMLRNRKHIVPIEKIERQPEQNLQPWFKTKLRFSIKKLIHNFIIY
jgi:hypothetical protein